MSQPWLLHAQTAALLALAALAGCGSLTNNDAAQAVVNERVIGMQAGDFFQQFGGTRTRSEQADGSTSYDWKSALGPTQNAGYYGLDERTCTLHLVADKKGKIASVDVVLDNVGRVSTSRCTEIFKAR
ncbi:MAG TPA: hypothetical protein VNS61_17280 [Caldimonas sp.]|nr:hypothetical protein [Caldimonas sp.]